MFVGETFRNLPFLTCWNRRNEETLMENITIQKTKIYHIPDQIYVGLIFNGSHVNCAKESKYNTNAKLDDIWTPEWSGLVLVS